MTRPRTAPTAITLALLLGAPVGLAHGFAVPYDLPVPLPLYLAGSGAAVLLSFAVTALFLRGGRASGDYPRFDLLRTCLGRLLFRPWVARTIEVAAVLVYLLVLVSGLIGNTNQSRNIAPVVVWIYWWVGVTYLTALVGHVWPLINPFRIIFEWAEDLTRRNDPDAELSLHLPYPAWLGVWPAVALFFAFAWFENVYHDPARPSNVATALMVYSVVTWAGMILFGKDEWLRRGEAFNLIFGLYARFAPTEMRVVGGDSSASSESAAGDAQPGDVARCSEAPDGCVNCFACFTEAPPERRQFNLRPFAAGLMNWRGMDISRVALVVLVLATVTFDGFKETPAWAQTVTRYYLQFGNVTGLGTVGLLAFPLLFMALYLLFCLAMPAAAGRRLGAAKTAGAFVLSLVPIALAYHLAHYLIYLLIQGQMIVGLASDPFGFGWNLFGTAGFEPSAAIVNARFAWFTAVGAVVIGHVLAVWLAHVVALQLFGGQRAAVRSQLPMLFLMVFYTVISLWILAQPIVEST